MVIFGVTLQEELSEAVEVLYHTSGHGRYSKKKKRTAKKSHHDNNVFIWSYSEPATPRVLLYFNSY